MISVITFAVGFCLGAVIMGMIALKKDKVEE